MLDKTTYTATQPAGPQPVRSTSTVISAWTISATKSWSPRTRAQLAAGWLRDLVTVKPTIEAGGRGLRCEPRVRREELTALEGVVTPPPLVAAYLNALP